MIFRFKCYLRKMAGNLGLRLLCWSWEVTPKPTKRFVTWRYKSLINQLYDDLRKEKARTTHYYMKCLRLAEWDIEAK